MVKVQMRDDDMTDVLKTDADLLELAVQAMLGGHNRRVNAMPEEIRIHGGQVPDIRRIKARIDEYPAALGIEQVRRDRAADDEPVSEVARRHALWQNLEPAQQDEQTPHGVG